MRERIISNTRSIRTFVYRKLSHIKANEVAESLIASWCIEYLRARRIGGTNVYQILAISVLMLIVKIIVEESKNGQTRRVVVSDRSA